MGRFEVVKSVPGYIRLADGSSITIRLVVFDIEEVGWLPTGLQLGIGHTVVLSVSAPRDLRERVEDKPLPTSDEHTRRKDIWEFVDILESSDAIEECVYTGSDGLKYRVRLRAFPTVVSRTLEYRDQRGNPIYFVRWGMETSVALERPR